MIQHIWTVPCRLTITDQETNNVSLIGVLEELTVAPIIIAENPPGGWMQPIFDIITLWARENQDRGEIGHARTRIISPTGEELMVQETEVDLRERKRLRSISRVLGFGIRQAGVYCFSVERREFPSAEWEEVVSIPLEVNIDPGLEQRLADIQV